MPIYNKIGISSDFFQKSFAGSVLIPTKHLKKSCACDIIDNIKLLTYPNTPGFLLTENTRAMPKLERTTFTITQYQNRWIAEWSEKTGLLKSEIVRRALDEYAEREAAKEERKLFTPEQLRKIREMARAKGVSVKNTIRRAVDRQLDLFFRKY